MQVNEIVSAVVDRTPKPDSVPVQIWEIIEKCWIQKPEDRPSMRASALLQLIFQEICSELQKLLKVLVQVQCTQ